MKANGVVTSIDQLLSWVTRLAWLNLLFIIGTLAGFFLLGLFPALTACLGVARKWLKGNRTLPVWKTFWHLYRNEWKLANGLGLGLLFVGGILYLNYLIIKSAEGEVLFIIPFAFYGILFFYGLIVLWIFPLIVHYKAKLSQQIKNAVIIGVTKIYISFGMAVLWFAVGYYSLMLPSLFPFFSFTFLFIGWMWLALQVFMKIPSTKNH
ncbi:putative membrane protein YesL [Bacillus pakistanensis]|uniref:Membrane protein YesL n=1 Tax=Rossellomorea pakistanensis TaxID=992288 RepID=A0ABS2NCY7_9BACI|nr:DUF624 domain-containing protein [Bacillus pakistanensis]MBM7585431.1 putative membrane protein YesL [Bacillus pakistanensis]